MTAHRVAARLSGLSEELLLDLVEAHPGRERAATPMVAAASSADAASAGPKKKRRGARLTKATVTPANKPKMRIPFSSTSDFPIRMMCVMARRSFWKNTGR